VGQEIAKRALMVARFLISVTKIQPVAFFQRLDIFRCPFDINKWSITLNNICL
jgi:hypothetical protein